MDTQAQTPTQVHVWTQPQRWRDTHGHSHTDTVTETWTDRCGDTGTWTHMDRHTEDTQGLTQTHGHTPGYRNTDIHTMLTDMDTWRYHGYKDRPEHTGTEKYTVTQLDRWTQTDMWTPSATLRHGWTHTHMDIQTQMDRHPNMDTCRCTQPHLDTDTHKLQLSNK